MNKASVVKINETIESLARTLKRAIEITESVKINLEHISQFLKQETDV